MTLSAEGAAGVTPATVIVVADGSVQVCAAPAELASVMAEATSAPQGAEELTAAVRAAQRGDEAAFRAVYRGVQPGLLRYLRVLVGADAEDVASETWLQITRDLGSFHGDADAFRGWASTIARHRATDHLRRARRRPAQPTAVEVFAEMASTQDTAGDALVAVDTDAAIALIATLPPDQAEAVLLRVVMGLDATAAARVLGKRSGAVRMAAFRGLRRLAGTLAARGGQQGVTDSEAATLRTTR